MKLPSHLLTSPHAVRIAGLYRQYGRELVDFLSHRLNCRELAADLVQELFARLLTAEKTVAAIRHDRGFLFCSAKNLAMEAKNSPKWREIAAIDPLSDEEKAPSPEQGLGDKQLVERLLQTIADFPPRCREVFILHRFDGLSYAAIARRLGISVSCVEKHMRSALDACRAQLDEASRRADRA